MTVASNKKLEAAHHTWQRKMVAISRMKQVTKKLDAYQT